MRPCSDRQCFYLAIAAGLLDAQRNTAVVRLVSNGGPGDRLGPVVDHSRSATYSHDSLEDALDDQRARQYRRHLDGADVRVCGANRSVKRT